MVGNSFTDVWISQLEELSLIYTLGNTHSVLRESVQNQIYGFFSNKAKKNCDCYLLFYLKQCLDLKLEISAKIEKKLKVKSWQRKNCFYWKIT